MPQSENIFMPGGNFFTEILLYIYPTNFKTEKLPTIKIISYANQNR
jgi:hypothetical protein